MSVYTEEYSEADLPNLMERLHPVRAKWYNLGLQLEISVGDLEAIQQEHRRAEDCLREMLVKWLKRVNPLPTETLLSAALQSNTVGGSKMTTTHSAASKITGLSGMIVPCMQRGVSNEVCFPYQ